MGMRNIARKVLLCVAGATVAAARAAAPAGAATPVVKGCVGTSLSTLAKASPAPGAFGHAVVSFAQDPLSKPGLGDGIQALQTGQVPQDVVPNTCSP
jgi:hypothetical protein